MKMFGVIRPALPNGTTPFVSDEYQMYQRGIDVEYQISEEDKAAFGITRDTISTSIDADEPTEPAIPMFGQGNAYFDVMKCVRSWIAANYATQAQKDGTPQLGINQTMTRKGYAIHDNEVEVMKGATEPKDMGEIREFLDGEWHIYNASELERQWQTTSPEFYQQTRELADRLGKYLTMRAFGCYSDLTDAFIETRRKEIEQYYGEAVMDEAITTYTWFTPNQPERITAADILSQ
ncbi:hypothetical protein A3C23_04650 [Candidatus Roizmanbacteria bacterium RIFCSPHIGHO2_02_FULL_37_13b]|uniref:Uncharacterized protein n=1 Tax=Candidatus Roizmanbacteria bacterium RIFCSPLOWO2_02_FULL_36_11 TaxID=1802071 RepID=A0A1F7JHA8_9BACT|nr:MAG: hypothetical protein A3C23_04650 [Candidatus Roizmanbacteria bacterium RIFCSPHIGHO2_02_FULL_37_13b]OGK54997.1 MAG: hypothetical protein A3H78_00790 [Candidatus Roizmanbacteria bacterium RIFCSPLOWO2_02_FULL_36_11]